MPLLYVFEIVLLVAIVAGGFFVSWDSHSGDDKQGQA
jgi:hypothetical protein